MEKSKILENLKLENFESDTEIESVELSIAKAIFEISQRTGYSIEHFNLEIDKYYGTVLIKFTYDITTVGLQFECSEKGKIKLDEYINDDIIDDRKLTIELIGLDQWMSINKLDNFRWALIIKSLINDQQVLND